MRDLSRLLSPRSIAVFGGAWAVKVIEECDRMGFRGEVWPVHPDKGEIGGRRAYASVSSLPDAPDAAFVGVNRHAAIDVVAALRDRGAGGAVVFASGFSETGDSALTTALLGAAGEMPVLGPNCYGFVNALDGAVIWPDQQGCRRVERGVAILSQSSNIAITLTMQRRGLPLAYVACMGNAAQVGLAGLAGALLADERVTALGLYVEGIGDAGAVADVVAAARAAGKGVVALKAGRSDAGRAVAMTHTAAMTGDAVVSSAFLAQAGVGEVSSLPELIEALKILHAYGPISAQRLMSVSCSGGEAGLMADAAQAARVILPPVPSPEAARLSHVLGPLVKIANPLDYQTFIWGDAAAMTEVFAASAAAGDAALFVLDLPREDRCSQDSYAEAFLAVAAARRATGRPVFVVATLPESVDEALAERFSEIGAVPLLGVPEAFAAIRAASAPAAKVGWRPYAAAMPGGEMLDEASGKAILSAAGIPVPAGVTGPSPGALDASELTPPFVLKALGLAHKSDAGAVRLGVRDPAQEASMPGSCGYLLEEMVTHGVAEILVGARRDRIFGVVLTLGTGGIEAELLGDTITLVAPVSHDEIAAALRKLRLWPRLDGFRGRPRADVAAAVEVAFRVQDMMLQEAALSEVEINPLIVRQEGAVAVDALIRKETR